MVEAGSSEESKKLRVAVIGASGAIGREIAHFARTNPNIGELVLVVRRTLEEWNQEEFQCKLTFVIKPDFDSFDDVADQLRGSDAFICCLGTRQKEGKDIFRQVDYQYPLNFAMLAQ